MKLNQNDLEFIKDQMQQGRMTADQANVELVRMRRVLLVIGRTPASVRKALNEAVKQGKLAHMKKDGHKPEAYFHPTFKHLAIAERNEHERSVMRALVSVCA